MISFSEARKVSGLVQNLLSETLKVSGLVWAAYNVLDIHLDFDSDFLELLILLFIICPTSREISDKCVSNPH